MSYGGKILPGQWIVNILAWRVNIAEGEEGFKIFVKKFPLA